MTMRHIESKRTADGRVVLTLDPETAEALASIAGALLIHVNGTDPGPTDREARRKALLALAREPYCLPDPWPVLAALIPTLMVPEGWWDVFADEVQHAAELEDRPVSDVQATLDRETAQANIETLFREVGLG